MKNSLRTVPVLLSFLLAVVFAAAWSGTARAEIKPDRLVGKWTGQMHVTDGKQSQDTEVGMEFTVDGKALLTGSDKKVEETTYSIDKDVVVLKDPDKTGEDVRLINIKLTATDLSADIVLSGEAQKQAGIQISVKLQKH